MKIPVALLLLSFTPAAHAAVDCDAVMRSLSGAAEQFRSSDPAQVCAGEISFVNIATTPAHRLACANVPGYPEERCLELLDRDRAASCGGDPAPAVPSPAL